MATKPSLSKSYVTLLAFISIFPTPNWNRWAGTHLTITMLTTVLVYAHRDLYPYATYHLEPQDKLGWHLWAKIAIAFVVSVFIPSALPRTFKPINPLVRTLRLYRVFSFSDKAASRIPQRK